MRSTYCLYISIFLISTAVFCDEKLSPNILKKWEFILSDAPFVFWWDDLPDNCFKILKNAKRKRQPWCNDLSLLLKQMLAASEAENIDVYKKCYEKKNGDNETIKSEMADWVGFKRSQRMVECAWIKQKNSPDSIMAIIVVTGVRNKKLSFRRLDNDKKYSLLHLRKVLYIAKRQTGYKFVEYKDDKLERLIKNEIYTSLYLSNHRPKDEYELWKKIRNHNIKQVKLIRMQKREAEKYNNFKKHNPLLSQKYGYSDKELHKLHMDITTANKSVGKMYESDPLGKFKKGISRGYIKILSKPILFDNINIKPSNGFSQKTIGELLRRWSYYDIQKINKGALGVTSLQVVAYEKLIFRGVEYFNFIGLYYTSNNANMVYIKNFDGIIFDKKRKVWRPVLGDIFASRINKTKMSRKKLKDAEEKYLLYGSLLKYYYPLERIISTNKIYQSPLMKKELFDKYLKNIKGFYDLFRLRTANECIACSLDTDLLEIPTVNPKKFNFDIKKQ